MYLLKKLSFMQISETRYVRKLTRKKVHLYSSEILEISLTQPLNAKCKHATKVLNKMCLILKMYFLSCFCLTKTKFLIKLIVIKCLGPYTFFNNTRR